MTKIVQILSGGDWCDANSTNLVVPEGMDVNKELKNYQAWALNVRERRDFRTFPEWLQERGARPTTDEEVLEIWE
jgi:hypothetical protein